MKSTRGKIHIDSKDMQKTMLLREKFVTSISFWTVSSDLGLTLFSAAVWNTAWS